LFIVGLGTYWVIIKPVLEAPQLAQIVVTFGLLIPLRSLAQLLWTADFRTIENPLLSGNLRLAGFPIGTGRLVAGFGAIASLVLLLVLLKRTRMGIALKATAEDRFAAELMGINTDRTMAIGWGLGLACVAVAGVLVTNFNYIFPQVGALFGLLSFLTVALGGFGSLVGVFVAGILVGLIESLGGFFVAPAYKYAIVFTAYLLVVLLKPRGLSGKF
jgi:branched-chain amino acid transport system permease protein